MAWIRLTCRIPDRYAGISTGAGYVPWIRLTCRVPDRYAVINTGTGSVAWIRLTCRIPDRYAGISTRRDLWPGFVSTVVFLIVTRESVQGLDLWPGSVSPVILLIVTEIFPVVCKPLKGLQTIMGLITNDPSARPQTDFLIASTEQYERKIW